MAAMELASDFLEAGRTGMGMFIESYFIFAIGNVNAIWEVLYPTCFDGDGPLTTDGKDPCKDSLVNALPCTFIASHPQNDPQNYFN